MGIFRKALDVFNSHSYRIMACDAEICGNDELPSFAWASVHDEWPCILWLLAV